MPYKIALAEIVNYDVDEALNYYDAVSLDLGARFEEDLQDAFKRIENHPYNYFNLEKPFRRIVLTHFPYMVVYKIDEGTQTVDVWALFHQKASPFFIKRRLRIK